MRKRLAYEDEEKLLAVWLQPLRAVSFVKLEVAWWWLHLDNLGDEAIFYGKFDILIFWPEVPRDEIGEIRQKTQ